MGSFAWATLIILQQTQIGIESTNDYLRGNPRLTVHESSKGKLYQPLCNLVASLERLSTFDAIPRSSFFSQFDGVCRYKVDTLKCGQMDLGIRGKLCYAGPLGKVLVKTEDSWVLDFNWVFPKSGLSRGVCLQVNTPLLNQYDNKTRKRMSGFMCPSTIHLAYGWVYVSNDRSVKIDVYPADLRWRTTPADLEKGYISTAEVGLMVKVDVRKELYRKLLFSFYLESEFSNSKVDGYGFAVSTRIDWSLWKFTQFSVHSDVKRDRLSGQALFLWRFTLGWRIDWTHLRTDRTSCLLLENQVR